MATVVFLRAVNVGGHQKFQPSVLAKSLEEFDVVNIGAAGTFVVREHIGSARLRDEILQRLPFEPGIMICPADEILGLAREDLFGPTPKGHDVRKFISVFETVPKASLSLPVEQPAGDAWQVRIVVRRGKHVLSWWRPDKKRLLYPNSVVEKLFRAPATTRSWNTVETICRVLKCSLP